MKPSKLYIKIFLIFLGLLIVTEVLIFNMFRVVVGKPLHEKGIKFLQANIYFLKEHLNNQFEKMDYQQFLVSNDLQKVVRDYSEKYDSLVWINNEERKVIKASFSGELPRIDLKSFLKMKMHYIKFRHGFALYLDIPVILRDKKRVNFNLYHVADDHFAHETGFMIGLGLIGVFVAGVLFIFSQFISRPIKILNHAALEISAGNLHKRVAITGRDEIGELARSFNFMAEQIQTMLNSTKELTAHVSHELRSPLARIRIALEILENSSLNGDNRDVLKQSKTINDEIEEMDMLIGRILHFSKLDINYNETKQETVDLLAVIEEIESRFVPLMNKNGLHYRQEIYSRSNMIHFEREDLKTALYNLYDNAIKYTPGGKNITLCLSRTEQGIEFKLSNFVGEIPEDDLDRMFRPFVKLGRSASEGSGFGLALTKKIITYNKATITAAVNNADLVLKIYFPQ